MSDHRFGATRRKSGRCEWKFWAPNATRVELLLCDSEGRATAYAMERLDAGFYKFEMNDVPDGQRYAFRLDGQSPRPDPASRWQPDGVHHPSAVWDAGAYEWRHGHGPGTALSDLVIYELHVGTFTVEGTFGAIIPRLADLQELGITAIELMPLGQSPGEWGWGYDGVYWFAVQDSYGGPAELQRLVDACHARGLGVILDVIYNHLGPEGNYLGEFGPFFSDRHQTPWGPAINYDGPSGRPVRDFVLENVRQWIRDFRIDGLRLDAVHAIFDDSPTSILAEIKQVADHEAARIGHPIHIIAESNLNDVRLLKSASQGGDGLDAQWSDDFHHCVHTLLTGERDGYYVDFHDPARQLVKAYNDVFVYDGCFSPFRERGVGAPVGDHAGDRFVISIQTHDQIGNRANGDRFGTLLTPAQQRLAAGLMLMAPNIPMLFMGEEYGETRPFPFFCDFGDEALREAVRKGRREEFASFAWSGDLPDPLDRTTYESAILSWNWSSDPQRAGLRNLYRELLTLRRTHPAMKDFQHRSARLIPNSADADVLLLVRGDPTKIQSCVVAVFNLSDKRILMSEIDRKVQHLLLSSDARRFGGSANESSGHSDTLESCAFAVFGNSSEVRV